MKGLILKDLFVAKKTGKLYLILMVFYMAMDLMSKESSFFMTFLMVFICMFPITAMSYDERAHWNKYALSMPIDRKDLVLGKYVFGLLCIVSVLLLSAVMIIIRILIKHEVFSMEMVMIAAVGVVVGMLIIAVTMPIMFALGTEKGRIFLMIIFVLVFLIPLICNQLDISLNLGNVEMGNEVLWIIPLIGIIIYVLSAVISIFIYKKKEVS